MPSGNRWGRAIGAGVLVELAVIVLVALTLGVYAVTVSRQTADLMAFGQRAGAWVAVGTHDGFAVQTVIGGRTLTALELADSMLTPIEESAASGRTAAAR